MMTTKNLKKEMIYSKAAKISRFCIKSTNKPIF
jgi:hypothetical protein